MYQNQDHTPEPATLCDHLISKVGNVRSVTFPKRRVGLRTTVIILLQLSQEVSQEGLDAKHGNQRDFDR